MSFGSHCTTRLIQTPELCHGRIEYTIHQLLGDLATCQARTSSKPVERLYGILDTWKIQISTSLQSSNLSWKGRTSEVDRRMAQRAKSAISLKSQSLYPIPICRPGHHFQQLHGMMIMASLLTSHPNRAVQRSLYATYPTTQVTCQTATACGQSLVTQAPMKIHTVTLHILHCKDRFSCFQSKKPNACGGRSASLAEKLAISFLLFTLEQQCSISENHPNHAKRFAGSTMA